MLSILFSISRITMLNDAFKKHFQIVLIDHKWPHNNDAKALDKSEVNSQCNWILSTNVAYIVYCHLFGNSIHCTDTSSATMPCVSGLTPAKTFKLVLVVLVSLYLPLSAFTHPCLSLSVSVFFYVFLCLSLPVLYSSSCWSAGQLWHDNYQSAKIAKSMVWIMKT